MNFICLVYFQTCERPLLTTRWTVRGVSCFCSVIPLDVVERSITFELVYVAILDTFSAGYMNNASPLCTTYIHILYFNAIKFKAEVYFFISDDDRSERLLSTPAPWLVPSRLHTARRPHYPSHRPPLPCRERTVRKRLRPSQPPAWPPAHYPR